MLVAYALIIDLLLFIGKFDYVSDAAYLGYPF